MRIVKFIFTSLISVFFINNATAGTSLGNIRAFIDKNYDEFVTELNFTGSIDLSKVEISHGKKELTVVIPKVTTAKKEAKLEIDDKEVKLIEVKRDKESVSIVLNFVKKINAKSFKGYTRIEKDGNLVRVSLKRHSYIVQQNKLKKEILKPVALDLNEKEEPAAVSAKVEKSESKLGKVDIVKKSENEIPVLASKKASAKEGSGSTISRLAISLGIVCCFAIGLIFFARWWSKNNKLQTPKSKIRVLNQHHLGPKKSLAIIRVAGEAILIGVTDHSINHIKTLSLLDGELPETVPTSFKNELNSNFEEEKVSENFSYGTSVKDTISKRLKGITR